MEIEITYKQDELHLAKSVKEHLLNKTSSNIILKLVEPAIYIGDLIDDHCERSKENLHSASHICEFLKSKCSNNSHINPTVVGKILTEYGYSYKNATRLKGIDHPVKAYYCNLI